MLSYYYENNAEILFTDYYKKQSDIFNNVISENLKLNNSFSALTNTNFYEQYLLNAFQFSFAKSEAQRLELQKLLFDKDGKKVDFQTFKKQSQQILQQFNETWQRVEYDLASRGSVLAEQWQQIWNDRDLYPYVRYQTRGDSRVRPEHAILDGIVFRIDSQIGQKLYVPNGWNCRCEWESIESTNEKILTDNELSKYLNGKVKLESGRLVDIVTPGFRSNVGIDGIFPKNGSTYNIKTANELDYTIFDVPKKLSSTKTMKLTEYQKFLSIKNNKINKNELIFRNFRLKLNFFLEEKILVKIQNNKGFELLNSCISKPTEIWGIWENSKEQKTVKFNFILKNFVVQIENGKIINAFTTDKINVYRKGLLI